MVGLLKRLALLVVLNGALGACAGRDAEAPLAPATNADPTERVLRLRAAARAIGAEVEPGRAEVELERIKAWTDNAEALLRAERNPSLRDLLLDTAEGELAALRARAALARARADLRRMRATSSKPATNLTPESPR